jgi:hypothetical protein
MANPEIQRRPVELRLTGSLDLPAARELCDTLIGAGREGVVVDVSLVREMHADAVALLSRALCLLGGRVTLRGLSRHHRRLLRYLGAPVGDDGGGEADGATAVPSAG